jgi:hypothetical protein
MRQFITWWSSAPIDSKAAVVLVVGVWLIAAIVAYVVSTNSPH